MSHPRRPNSDVTHRATAKRTARKRRRCTHSTFVQPHPRGQPCSTPPPRYREGSAAAVGFDDGTQCDGLEARPEYTPHAHAANSPGRVTFPTPTSAAPGSATALGIGDGRDSGRRSTTGVKKKRGKKRRNRSASFDVEPVFISIHNYHIYYSLN